MNRLFALPLATSLALASGLAGAAEPRPIEPWSDADPALESERYAIGEYGVRAGAEYRARGIYVNPMSPSGDGERATQWFEHRLRLDAAADYRDQVRIVTSADVLDGVMWGDNGAYGGTPSSISGANVSARNPNVSRPCVGLTGPNPLEQSSYGYTACPADVFKVRKAYGEVALPFGLLRVGRQPVNIGMGVQSADGEGRANRFGVSRTGNLVDRILFATKPLEGLKPAEERDKSASRGLIFAMAYDHIVTDAPGDTSAAVRQWDTALRYLAPDHALGRDLVLGVHHAYRWDTVNATRVNSLGARAMSRFGPIHAGVDVAANIGTTREIAQAYQAITSDPVVDQSIRQLGARAVLRYDHRLFSVYLEGDYASGDGDPQVRTPLTQFTFAEDTNVGLLLFKHALGYQTARAAAAGVETLQRLGATSMPAEAIATRGAFTNAIAIFPQVDVRPHPSILIRAGVLLAWAAARVVNPIASLQRRDGLTIEDDLVNFAGGKPARHYGTELDGRIQWRYADHFALDLEGALLLPGDALKDQDGYAVRSVLVEGRSTYFF